MTFQTIKKGQWQAARRPKSVNRVAYSTGSSGDTLVFSVSGDLYSALGSPNRVKLMLGSGEHKGKMLVKGAADNEPNSYSLVGQKEGHQRKFTVSAFRLGLSSKKARYKTTTTNHRMTEEGLMVWLPE